MRQQEAEQEAARRNAEDERRGRFVFYALDHSAGMVKDAWEVEMRLRPRRETVAASVPVAAAPAGEPLEAAPSASPEPPPMPAAAPLPAEEPLAGAMAPGDAEPVELASPAAGSPAVRATEPEPMDMLPALHRLRRPRLIQVWGIFVICVGLLFTGATLLLAVGLRDYTHFGLLPTTIGVGLGLIAVLVGVALVRTV